METLSDAEVLQALTHVLRRATGTDRLLPPHRLVSPAGRDPHRRRRAGPCGPPGTAPPSSSRAARRHASFCGAETTVCTPRAASPALPPEANAAAAAAEAPMARAHRQRHTRVAMGGVAGAALRVSRGEQGGHNRERFCSHALWLDSPRTVSFVLNSSVFRAV